MVSSSGYLVQGFGGTATGNWFRKYRTVYLVSKVLGVKGTSFRTTQLCQLDQLISLFLRALTIIINSCECLFS